MALTTDLAKQIDAYIKTHPDCETRFTQRLELKGKLHEMPVYRLPTTLLRFNIRNGRFAAEYRELVKKEGRELDPEKAGDVEKIKKLLLEANEKYKEAAKILKDDLQKVGQRTPGVVTFDGSLINGNRRMAVFDELRKETGDEKWRFLEVSRLPPDASERDVWRIEAGLQFSREERLDYGPVNELLKFREGIKAGLSPKEIAATLYGGFTEDDIKRDLKRLEMIDTFLLFIRKPGHYKTIQDRGWHEHFIDLQNFLESKKAKGVSAAELLKIQKYAFDLIKNDVSHLKLRKLGNIMGESKAKEHLLKEIDKPAIVAIISPKQDLMVQPKHDPAPPQPHGKDSPTVQLFDDAIDIADAAEQSGKPRVLLNRALTNLKGIDLAMLKAGDKSLKGLVEDIEKEVSKIRKKVSGK